MRESLPTRLLLLLMQATAPQLGEVEREVERILARGELPQPDKVVMSLAAPAPTQGGVATGSLEPAGAQPAPEAFDVKTAFAELLRQLRAVAQGDYDLRKANGQLQEENDSLRAMQYGGALNFVLDVEREDFLAFAFIMALGNRNAAAEALKVPQRSFYDRLERWKNLGKSYRDMLRWVQWRKAVARKIKVRLPDTSTGQTAANPQLLHEVIEAAGESSSRNYPSLLREILGVLQAQNPENWESARRDLVALIKDEVPQ